MASAQDLLKWIKTKLVDDTISMSDRADFEAWASLAKRRTELKPGESRQFKKLSQELEERYEAEIASGAQNNMKWPCTTAQIAGLFGKTSKTIAEWTKTLGMPKEKFGEYDFRKVFPWWMETIYHPPEDRDESITEARRRERLAKAELAEMDLAERKGEIMKKEGYEQQIAEACMALRNTMLSWPSRVFPDDNDNRKKLREEVHRLLMSFYRNCDFIDNSIEEPPEAVVRKPTKKKKPIKRKR